MPYGPMTQKAFVIERKLLAETIGEELVGNVEKNIIPYLHGEIWDDEQITELLYDEFDSDKAVSETMYDLEIAYREFMDKTGLELQLMHHCCDDSGGPYDDIDGAFWIVNNAVCWSAPALQFIHLHGPNSIKQVSWVVYG